ncbi:MAG: hypothetical protein HYX92_21045 [Chloroflexi bacterium]|nr:hypothetical protein [Chloroflexota bacterium]
MKTSVSAASLITLLMLTASCAPAATTSAPSAATGSPAATPAVTAKAASEGPKYGGTLTVPTTGDPPSLDVAQEATYPVVTVLQSAYNGLVQSDPENPEEVIGDLAKSWEISKDGLAYTFRLHENVKFHDGAPFTSEDIKTSFDRQLDPPRGIRAPRRPEMEAIAKVETPDKDTIRLLLKYPFGSLFNVFSSGYQVIYSKSFLEKKGDMKKDVMGTGPYKLKNYSPGVSVEHIKNPDYFVKGRPYLDGITFYIIADAATRLAAFRTGRVRLTGPGEAGLMPTDTETVKKEIPNVVIISYPSLQYGNVTLNTAQKPFSDIRVRKAVSLAFDRHNALKLLAQGYGEVGSHFPGKWGIPKEQLATIPGWRQPKDADIAEARRLLAEAGYPDGLATKALVRTEKINSELSVYIANELAKVGIKYELDIKETAVRTALLTEGAFNAYASHSAYMYPDPQNESRFWTPPLRGDWGQNWARVDDKRIVDLWARQARATDPSERAKIVRELDLALIDVAGKIVIYWRNGLVGMWPEVRGRGKLIGNYNFQKYQNVWLAK